MSVQTVSHELGKRRQSAKNLFTVGQLLTVLVLKRNSRSVVTVPNLIIHTLRVFLSFII